MIPIEDVLPHRAPFLFLDEIVELSSDRVVARRTVRADEAQFAGHYPGRPVMPGVLLCEAVLQAGCYLMGTRESSVAMQGDPTWKKTVPVVARIADARFKRMVRPGDTLEISAAYERTVMGAHFLSGAVKVDGNVAAQLSFTVMVAPSPEQDPAG